MAMDTTRFLAQVQLKGAIPTGRFSDAEIFDIAYDVLLAEAQPFLISLREEFYVKKSTQFTTAGTTTYAINPRASGMALRELKYSQGGNIVDLARIDPTTVNDTLTGTPHSFYLEGSNIVLYPVPDNAGTLTQTYFQRVGKPVAVSEAAQITAIDTVTGIITASAPSTWTTANRFDLITAVNGNDTIAKDLTASAVSTTALTFTASDLPSSLAIGDYVALAGETPYIQVPDDAIPMVQHMVVAELLENMGSQQELAVAMAKVDKMKAALVRVLSDRVRGAQISFMPQF